MLVGLPLQVHFILIPTGEGIVEKLVIEEVQFPVQYFKGFGVNAYLLPFAPMA